MKKVTNGDIGRGGLKFDIFAVTSFLNDPLRPFFYFLMVIYGSTFKSKLYRKIVLLLIDISISLH